MHFECILEHSAFILEHSGTFWNILAMSGTFWNILHVFWNILHTYSNYLAVFSNWVTDRRTLGLVELRLRS